MCTVTPLNWNQTLKPPILDQQIQFFREIKRFGSTNTINSILCQSKYSSYFPFPCNAYILALKTIHAFSCKKDVLIGSNFGKTTWLFTFTDNQTFCCEKSCFFKIRLLKGLTEGSKCEFLFCHSSTYLHSSLFFK